MWCANSPGRAGLAVARSIEEVHHTVLSLHLTHHGLLWLLRNNWADRTAGIRKENPVFFRAWEWVTALTCAQGPALNASAVGVWMGEGVRGLGQWSGNNVMVIHEVCT